MLADGDCFGNDVRHLLGRSPDGDRKAAEQIGGLGMTDPPDHTTLRRVLGPQFTKHRLAGLQGSIDAVVSDALDDLEARGPVVDLVQHFGFAVPFRVICDLLGMPDVDREEFRSRGSARFDLRDAGSGGFEAAASTRQFLIDMVAAERRSPHLPDGMISRMVADHGHELDDVALGGLADGVFLGGYETSASMLSLGTYVLTQHPDVWRQLRDGTPEDANRIVEELLRYVCPVQVAFPRFARRPVDLGDARINEGDVVVVSLSGVNRDPRTHPAADAFDPTAPSGGHLAFGHGLHRCVGAELARMELRTALTGLARRFPDLSVVEPAEGLSFTELSAVYSVASLPVRLA
jgi:cytochrome P450